jgi:hypothetical protein
MWPVPVFQQFSHNQEQLSTFSAALYGGEGLAFCSLGDFWAFFSQHRERNVALLLGRVCNASQ